MAKSVFNFFHFEILEYLNRFVYHSQYFLPYYCSLEVLGKSRKLDISILVLIHYY
ncbi:CBM_collapsed_G0052580.mRNA.1.CDS.1 [Saccharomyces cerevisiae]|nr:CBM_collapsed_G0052580.mRNA.1.CDS.1 [Saccharomyces cerevisiae]